MAFEQNTSMNVYSTDDSDNITISFHNSGPSIGSNSTMTVFGWFAGATGTPGSDGGPGAPGAQGIPGVGSSILAADEGVDFTDPATKINAVGAGVTATIVAGTLILTVPGGGGVTPTHTEQYLAGKASQDFDASDFTGTHGVAYSAGSHTATLPAIVGNVYAAVARISTDPEPTYADVNSQGINQFSDFTKRVAEIDIGNGDMYEVWVSDYAVFADGDTVEFR